MDAKTRTINRCSVTTAWEESHICLGEITQSVVEAITHLECTAFEPKIRERIVLPSTHVNHYFHSCESLPSTHVTRYLHSCESLISLMSIVTFTHVNHYLHSCESLPLLMGIVTFTHNESLPLLHISITSLLETPQSEFDKTTHKVWASEGILLGKDNIIY